MGSRCERSRGLFPLCAKSNTVLMRLNGQSLNGKQGTELAGLIVHKITEVVSAIAFK
jgi:hypothetical protein